MNHTGRVIVTEVGPRDGLQNEPETIPVSDKVAFIDRLSASGVSEIEATAFVSPRWIPQLADACDVMSQISRSKAVCYSALVPNLEGWQRACDSGVDKIAVFTAASDTFSKKNTNATIAETLDRFGPVIAAARDAGCPVRGYISCAVACPYDGSVRPEQVVPVVEHLLGIGVDEIDLGDTIGVATPTDIEALLEAVTACVPIEELVLHLHDTHGRALSCCQRALELGVRRFDASCGGLGGCPFAPGAKGNLATEELLGLCDRLGMQTGVDRDAIQSAGDGIEAALGRPLPARLNPVDPGNAG